jgi:hypothetical protein
MASTEQRRSLDEFEDDFDPDLDISKGRDKVWLVKLPKWLMEHWSKTDQDNVELARIHIPYAPLLLNLLTPRTTSSGSGSVFRHLNYG